MLSINEILFCLTVGFGVQAAARGKLVTKEQQSEYSSMTIVCAFDEAGKQIDVSSGVIIEENLVLAPSYLFNREDGQKVHAVKVYIGILDPNDMSTKRPLIAHGWLRNPDRDKDLLNKGVTLIITKGMDMKNLNKIRLVHENYVVKSGDIVRLVGYGNADDISELGHLNYKDVYAMSGEDLSKYCQVKLRKLLNKDRFFGVGLFDDQHTPAVGYDVGGNNLFYCYFCWKTL